jgi:hypothetical protein
MTFNPSDNITFANCLASTSVGNPFVILGKGARDEFARHSLGAWTETYQWLMIALRLAMIGHRRLLEPCDFAQDQRDLHRHVSV